MNPICFALDVPTLAEAQSFVDRLEPYVGAFKVGLELFIASGSLVKTKKPIVLDLKLHDIPETVERAIKAGGDRGARAMTLHVQQRATLERAAKAAEPYDMTLLGVTVLTSLAPGDMDDLRFSTSDPKTRAGWLARFGWECGLRGFVCSPMELSYVKHQVMKHHEGKPFFLVPGIRPRGADAGDQVRIGTPESAVKDGADLIVIGRPIRDAADPVQAAQAICQELGVPPV
jgi:orotidine-5'-phosphate decarboxylase